MRSFPPPPPSNVPQPLVPTKGIPSQHVVDLTSPPPPPPRPPLPSKNDDASSKKRRPATPVIAKRRRKTSSKMISKKTQVLRTASTNDFTTALGIVLTHARKKIQRVTTELVNRQMDSTFLALSPFISNLREIVITNGYDLRLFDFLNVCPKVRIAECRPWLLHVNEYDMITDLKKIGYHPKLEVLHLLFSEQQEPEGHIDPVQFLGWTLPRFTNLSVLGISCRFNKPASRMSKVCLSQLKSLVFYANARLCWRDLTFVTTFAPNLVQFGAVVATSRDKYSSYNGCFKRFVQAVSPKLESFMLLAGQQSTLTNDSLEYLALNPKRLPVLKEMLIYLCNKRSLDWSLLASRSVRLLDGGCFSFKYQLEYMKIKSARG